MRIARAHGIISPRTDVCNLDETVLFGAEWSIAELAIDVETRGPHAAILLQHHAMMRAESHGLDTTRDGLNENGAVSVCPITELAVGI